MNRHRVLTALVALIAVGVVAAVIYLETSVSSSAATTTTSTTTTTVPPTTLPPTTLPPTTTSTTTTLPPTTTSTTTTLPPPERALVPVVVSSGPSDGQRLAPGTQLIAAAGWTDIRSLTGSLPLTETVVFYADGMQSSAELLAADAGLEPTAVAPLADAPPVAGLANAQLLFYLGGS